jgi:hypothetical protein
VCEQIGQVLFTNPGERVLRPESGAGLRNLVFEPNASSLWGVTGKRLSAAPSTALQDAVPVGIDIKITIVVQPNYFRSEVRQIAEQLLGRGPGGFFEPGRLRLDEDIHLGDIYQVLTGIAGVDRVSVVVFKRHGSLYEDQATSGRIQLDRDEIVVCDNHPDRPAHGSFLLHIDGGRKG